jgi:DNA mismatch endonuclease (patch repair protein)
MIAVFRRSHIRGWRRNYRLPGRPDFAFPKLRLALFVDGCFWHGCSLCYKKPSSNAAYWTQKLHGNQARDRRISNELTSCGWTVVRIWEHEINREGFDQGLVKQFGVFQRRHAKRAAKIKIQKAEVGKTMWPDA